ncbi:hydrolase, partial [Leptospira bandrabouensis]|nr:hydrolase [Leptospira bandrabouensis]
MAQKQEDKHNIPEGLIKPVPFQKASEPKKKILFYSFAWFLLSALSFSLGITFRKKVYESVAGESVRILSVRLV